MCSRHYHWSKRAGFPDHPWEVYFTRTGGIREGEKICNYCKTIKPRNHFYQRGSGGYAVFENCKECTSIIAKARRRNDPLMQPIYARSSKFLRYGITVETYLEMLEQQSGVCKICRGANKNGFDLAVDHDHRCCPGKGSCGECVRGLLCRKCNSGIGLLADSPEVFRMAAAYLEATNEKLQHSKVK